MSYLVLLFEISVVLLVIVYHFLASILEESKFVVQVTLSVVVVQRCLVEEDVMKNGHGSSSIEH